MAPFDRALATARDQLGGEPPLALARCMFHAGESRRQAGELAAARSLLEDAAAVVDREGTAGTHQHTRCCIIRAWYYCCSVSMGSGSGWGRQQLLEWRCCKSNFVWICCFLPWTRVCWEELQYLLGHLSHGGPDSSSPAGSSFD